MQDGQKLPKEVTWEWYWKQQRDFYLRELNAMKKIIDNPTCPETDNRNIHLLVKEALDFVPTSDKLPDDFDAGVVQVDVSKGENVMHILDQIIAGDNVNDIYTLALLCCRMKANSTNLYDLNVYKFSGFTEAECKALLPAIENEVKAIQIRQDRVLRKPELDHLETGIKLLRKHIEENFK